MLALKLATAIPDGMQKIRGPLYLITCVSSPDISRTALRKLPHTELPQYLEYQNS